ncbi:MAG: diaminopimelate decarboxylase [Actinomycetota bacterium]|nr:diaminopimelate decarboxylase [Actinomycetota bacterium]
MPHTLKDVLPATARMRDDGHLEVGGADVIALAEQHDTPLYVLCEETLRRQCRRYVGAFPGARIYFAAKSFTAVHTLRVAVEEGLGVDVASGGELYTALTARVPVEAIVFHGNNKSDAELAMAVESGVGRVAVDSLDELERLSEIAASAAKVQAIVLRVTPGIEAHTHEYIQTGQEDSKFGLSIESGLAIEAAKRAADLPGVDLVGIHAHIGSQIFGPEAFMKLVEVMFEFLDAVRSATGVALPELNLGGGLGIAYTKEESPADIELHARLITEAVEREASKWGIPTPRLCVEPGRSLIANAMLTLYRVGVVKEIPGIRTYVSVDGGMSDNIRPMLYGARYSALVANKCDEHPTLVVTIAGSHCESGDILVKDVAVPESIRRGDVLALLATGAYGYTMASNYNKMRRPAIVAVRDGKSRVIVRRETFEDLVRLDEPG